MRNANDWRLTNQEMYLMGVALVWQPYSPASSDNDHDHCEFCFAKFMMTPGVDILHEGYCSRDRNHWVCKTCCDDFIDLFGWRIERA